MKKRNLKQLVLAVVFAGFLLAPAMIHAQIPGGPGDGEEEGAPEAAESADKSDLWRQAKERGRKSVDSATDEPDDSGRINPLELPYLSIYYVQPIVDDKADVKIKCYVSDWYQSEWRLDDHSHRFNIRLTIDLKESMEDLEKPVPPRVLELKNVKAGDHEFVVKGPWVPGEYRIELVADDMHGRRANQIYHEFWARPKSDIEISEKETFRMQEKHLTIFKNAPINNKGDYGIFYFVDAKGKSWKESIPLVEKAAKKIKVPSGRYVVVVPGEKYDREDHLSWFARSKFRGAHGCPLPEWLPLSYSNRACKVIYAKDYDHDRVEAEAKMTSNGLNRLLKVAARQGYRKVVLLPGTYRISHTEPIKIPSGMTLDLNGATIKMNQFIGAGGVQIVMDETFDSHVVNGIVEGDYFEHDYANSPDNSEWVCGIGMKGECKYSSYERILVRYITGYGVSHGISMKQYGKARGIGGFEPGTIDVKTGEYKPDVDGLAISDMFPVGDFYDNVGYVAASKYLGYQGRSMDQWNILFHFYDDDEKYLETVSGWQYHRARIPEKAGFARLTVYSNEPPISSGICTNLFHTPWNSWYENLFILQARCVGMAAAGMNNFKIANCSFVRSGESLATCAYDSEDGWDMMQDVWLYRNSFYKNPRNGLLTCAGHNFVIEDNEGHLNLYSRTQGYVARNNDFTRAFYGCGGRVRTLLPRVENNNYSVGVSIGDAKGGGDVDETMMEAVGDEEKNADGTPKMKRGWFIVVKDATKAPRISCGKTGMLVGVRLANVKEKSRLNMLAGELVDSEKLEFGGANYMKSRLVNLKGTLAWGMLTIRDCQVIGMNVSVSTDGEVMIRDADLRNVQFNFGSVKPARLTFLNCVIDNDKPLISIPAATISDITFINCEISGSSPVIMISHTRKSNYDDMRGTVRFQDCIFNIGKNPVIDVATDPSKCKKPLTFENAGNRLKGKFLAKQALGWGVMNTDGSGPDKRVPDVHRGRKSKTGSLK